MRPGAWLRQLVWQEGDRQEWWRALTGARVPPTAAPFSLGDTVVTEGILRAAGYTEVEFQEIAEPVHYGSQADAYEFVTGWRMIPKDGDRLRAVLADHDTGDGVRFESRAWLVTARRA